jgi:hypothetical protein
MLLDIAVSGDDVLHGRDHARIRKEQHLSDIAQVERQNSHSDSTGEAFCSSGSRGVRTTSRQQCL